MNVFLVTVVSWGVVCSVVLFPELVVAQGFMTCDGTVCSACHFVDMVNKVITWLISVLLMVFAVRAVVSGFKLVMSQGNPGALSSAKEGMVNTLIGLLIILSAWLIVDTLIRGLGVVDERGGPLPWAEVKCQIQTVPELNLRESPAGANVLPQFAGRASDPASLTAAQQTLSTAGVGVQNGVQLEGVSASRLEEIARLARECETAMGRSCGIQVSSGVRQPGNPAGVGAHGTGQALDLSSRNSPVFNEWMRTRQNQYQRVQSFGGFSGYQISPNTVCTWEGPDGDSRSAHWHCAPPTR